MAATLIYSESLVSNPHLYFLLIQRTAVGQNPILFKVYELLLYFRIFAKKNIYIYLICPTPYLFPGYVTPCHFSHLRGVRQEDQIITFISDILIPSSFFYPNVPLSKIFVIFSWGVALLCEPQFKIVANNGQNNNYLSCNVSYTESRS